MNKTGWVVLATVIIVVGLILAGFYVGTVLTRASIHNSKSYTVIPDTIKATIYHERLISEKQPIKVDSLLLQSDSTISKKDSLIAHLSETFTATKSDTMYVLDIVAYPLTREIEFALQIKERIVNSSKEIDSVSVVQPTQHPNPTLQDMLIGSVSATALIAMGLPSWALVLVSGFLYIFF